MACGTPVVATANPGALEVTGKETFGVITEVDLFGQTLSSVITDHKLRLDLREQGLDHVQHFDILKVDMRYLETAKGTGKL
jgi:glycosyltransferase involved in cell wall biosynthesis